MFPRYENVRFILYIMQDMLSEWLQRYPDTYLVASVFNTSAMESKCGQVRFALRITPALSRTGQPLIPSPAPR